MKANEIMLGDWVRIRWTCCNTGREVVKDFQIMEIRKNGNTLYAWSKNGNMARVEDLEPIPLTAEILEKNGFMEAEVVVVGTRKMIWESEDGRTEITIWMDDTMPMHIRKNIYYEDEVCYTLPFACTANQLQHALRLCGIDLAIVI